jgi:hypothetical protein
MFDGQKREFDPSVERTEMERGVPKQRLLNTQVLVKQAMSLYFDSISAAEQFEAWYFNEIRRIDWFTMVHPYTGAPVTVRFEGGAIGELVPDDKFSSDYRRDVVVEYLR